MLDDQFEFTEVANAMDSEWLAWANAVFCGDERRSGQSGPRGGFTSVQELRDWLAARLDRRHKNRLYVPTDVHGTENRKPHER